MSFGFAAQGSSAFGGGAPANPSGSAQSQSGPALGEITTEKLGFHALAGDAKLQLFTTAWPSETLPPPTSSLLTISSTKGLLAAASPDAVVVATTAAVRDAFSSDVASNGNLKPFTPQLTIQIGTRISQVAFSSDGNYLIISAETGGGLAVYETQSLLAGQTKSAFELGTDQTALRALAPNPATESANLIALVTTNGDLMIADMNKRGFVSGPNGQILKAGVSCLSWSNKGKQLVAGLGNGTGFQMAPDGAGKAEIPRAPDLDGDMHVSSIFWLENDLFLMAYTPSASQDGMVPATEYRLITRQPKTTNFMFQALPEACSPFGFSRQPSFQFLQRLRTFPPSIKDIVVVASTSSDDVGLYTRASESLSNDSTAPDSRDTFTLTSMADDSRRAAIPMAENMMDSTSAIGLALDLSSNSNVSRPIPGDELEESKGPLPAVFILNHMGVLSGWWVVYTDSVRQGTLYPGLVAAGGDQQTQSQAQPAPAFGTSPAPGNTTAFGSTPAFGNSSAPAFGAPSKPAASFGGGAAFGSPASLSSKQSPWGGATSGAAPAFGQPSFGQPSFGSASPMGAAQKQAPAFGSASSVGAKPSLWGNQSSGSVFGQASGLSSQRPNPFGSGTGSALSSGSAFGSGSSGFASFAQGGGFAAAASNAPKTGGESIFKQPTAAGFDAQKKTESPFGSSNQGATGGGGLFGSTPAQGFKITSPWANSNAGKADDTKTAQDGPSLFGSGFSNALSAAKSEDAAVSKEADMMEDETPQNGAQSKDNTATNTSQTATPASGGLFDLKPATGTFGTPAPGGLFGTTTTKPNTVPPAPSTGLFGSKSPALAGGLQKSIESDEPAKQTTEIPQPPVKDEPKPETSAVDKTIPEAPLPPEPTSKKSYTPGTSSDSSVSFSKPTLEEPPLPPNPFQAATQKPQKDLAEDAPLPPDFTARTPSKDDAKKSTVDQTRAAIPSPPGVVPPEEDDTLPASDESDQDDESSGVDVGNELLAGAGQSPDISPVSSFGLRPDKHSTASSFQNLESSREGSSKSGLFGEIGGSSMPTFAPPQKALQSPRSPSPVRLGPKSSLRPDPSRSVSAPGVPLRVDGSRKVTLGRPSAARGVYPPVPAEQSYEEERERISQQRARAQAEAQQELSDGEDEKTREYLDEDVPATLELESFVAHQDYVGHVSKPGIPGQVERVYRDINSMVDTLGLNARSLASFVKGHEELYLDQGRTKDDLEKDNNWALSEIENLIEIQDNLEKDLETEEIQDPSVMLSMCNELLKELSRAKARQSDIKHSVDVSQDPTLLEALRAAPLSAEQSSMRHDLRAKYTELQHTLAQCEESISMLKAKTASIQSSKSKSAGSSNVPTVEAVEKTILKMTSMFEKRSGDIDLLESQMRNLNVAGSTSNTRENSPFATPPPQGRRAIEASPASSINGRSFYTPGSRRSALANSTFTTPYRLNRTPGKKMAEVDNAVAQQYAAKASRKKQARTILKDALMAGDTRVRTLDDL